MSLDFKSNTYIGLLIKVMGVGLFLKKNFHQQLFDFNLGFIIYFSFFNICLLYSQINILAFSWYSILQTYSFSTI